MVFIDLIMMFELVGVWFLGELVFFSFEVLSLFEVLIFGQDFIYSSGNLVNPFMRVTN